MSEKRFRKWRMTERQLERSMTCFGEEEIPRLPWDKNPLEVHWSTFRKLGYERVYLLFCKVADTPFYIQGDFILSSWN